MRRKEQARSNKQKGKEATQHIHVVHAGHAVHDVHAGHAVHAVHDVHA